MIVPQVVILVIAGGSVTLALMALAVVCLHWRTAQRHCDRVEQTLTAKLAAAEAELEAMRLAVQKVCKDVDELESATASSPLNAKNGLNLSRRSQALRLHRRGEGPQQIASALGVPRQEVDLLLKVHQIIVANV